MILYESKLKDGVHESKKRTAIPTETNLNVSIDENKRFVIDLVNFR